MLDGRHQYQSFAVRERGRGKATDGTVEKVLILVELHHVIARCGVRQNMIPVRAVPYGTMLLVA